MKVCARCGEQLPDNAIACTRCGGTSFQGGKPRSTNGPQQRPANGPQQRPPQQRPANGPQQRPVNGPQQRPTNGPQQRPANGPQQRPPQQRPVNGPQQRPTNGPQQRPNQNMQQQFVEQDIQTEDPFQENGFDDSFNQPEETTKGKKAKKVKEPKQKKIKEPKQKKVKEPKKPKEKVVVDNSEFGREISFKEWFIFIIKFYIPVYGIVHAILCLASSKSMPRTMSNMGKAFVAASLVATVALLIILALSTSIIGSMIVNMIYY